MPITNIAVFVDYENIHISLERQYHIVPEPNRLAQLVTEEIKKMGKILVGQAYADWEEYDGVQPAFKKHGIDPRYVLSKTTVHMDAGHEVVTRKNSSDIALALDASETLHTRDDVDAFVIISGDRDFIELVSKLHNRKKNVVLIGVEKTTSRELRESADSFISIENLFGINPSQKDVAERPSDFDKEETWEWFVNRIEELEKSHSFLGLKYLTQTLLPDKKTMVAVAIERGILSTYKVDNPAKKEFPTTACRLNHDDPVVKKSLKKGLDK